MGVLGGPERRRIPTRKHCFARYEKSEKSELMPTVIVSSGGHQLQLTRWQTARDTHKIFTKW